MPAVNLVGNIDLNHGSQCLNDALAFLKTCGKGSLLTVEKDNTKLGKAKGTGYVNVGLSLAPHTVSGYNVCASATPGCSAACLNFAGRGRFSNVQKSRIRKTQFFFENRGAFMYALVISLANIQRKNPKRQIAFRPNIFSDVKWENISVWVDDHLEEYLKRYYPRNTVGLSRATLEQHIGVPMKGLYGNIFEIFPRVKFYDYTKHKPTNRDMELVRNDNYHLTYSVSGEYKKDRQSGDLPLHPSILNNRELVRECIARKLNMAIVIDDEVDIPIVNKGYTIINGDEDDLRFLDPKPCLIRLSPKGDAKTDTSGFVFRGGDSL